MRKTNMIWSETQTHSTLSFCLSLLFQPQKPVLDMRLYLCLERGWKGKGVEGVVLINNTSHVIKQQDSPVHVCV